MGPQPMPAPFLEQLKFIVPINEQARYKTAHLKYGKTSPNNPLKVTVSGETAYDIVLTSKASK